MANGKPGRPRKAEKYGGHIAAAEDRIADRLPDLIDNLLRLAAGVTIREEGKDGQERTYREPPDFKANAYLIDRILGRPTQAVEVTGEDGGPVELVATLAAGIAKVYGGGGGAESDPPGPLPDGGA